MLQKAVTYSVVVSVGEEISSWRGKTALTPVRIGENGTARADCDDNETVRVGCDGHPVRLSASTLPFFAPYDPYPRFDGFVDGGPFSQSLHWQLEVQRTPIARQLQYFRRHLVVQHKNDLRVRTSRKNKIEAAVPAVVVCALTESSCRSIPLQSSS
jgi:hypothetical protein